MTLTDPLPAGVTFVSATPMQGSCTQGGGTVTCNIGRVDSGATANVEIVVRPTTAGPITNVASVSGEATDFNPGNNAAAVTTTVSDASQ